MKDKTKPSGETGRTTDEVPEPPDAPGTSTRRRLPAAATPDLKKIRVLVARVVWAVCVLCALALASAVLMIALDANADNDLVTFVVDAADKVDLGFFDLTNPIKDFDKDLGPGEDTKTALFNYGLGAVVWLVIGRLADRVIRP